MTVVASSYAETAVTSTRIDAIDPYKFFDQSIQILAEPETLKPGEIAHFDIPDESYLDMAMIGLALQHRTLGNYFLERRRQGISISDDRDSKLQIRPAFFRTLAELPDETSLDYSHLSELNYPATYGPKNFKHKPVVDILSYSQGNRSVFNITNAQLPHRVPEIHHDIVVAPVRLIRPTSKVITINLGLGL